MGVGSLNRGEGQRLGLLGPAGGYRGGGQFDSGPGAGLSSRMRWRERAASRTAQLAYEALYKIGIGVDSAVHDVKAALARRTLRKDRCVPGRRVGPLRLATRTRCDSRHGPCDAPARRTPTVAGCTRASLTIWLSAASGAFVRSRAGISRRNVQRPIAKAVREEPPFLASSKATPALFALDCRSRRGACGSLLSRLYYAAGPVSTGQVRL